MYYIKQKLKGSVDRLVKYLQLTALVIFLSATPFSAVYADVLPVPAAGPSPSTSCPSGTSPISASDTTCEDDAIKCVNDNCDLIQKYINPAIDLLSAVFGTIAVISIIIGGIQYTSSGGDPQKVAESKKRLTNTIISLVAFLFLYAFLQFLIPGGLFNRPTAG
jgi:hypothetical protein